MLLQIAFDQLSNATDDFSRFIYSFPVQIRILMGIAMLFVIFIFILFAIIIGSRIYKTKLAIKQKNIRQKYKPIFSQLLFEDDDRLLGSDFLKLFDEKEIYKPSNRRFILSELIHLRQNFRGETGSRIELIFRKLNFHLDCLKKLNSYRWYKKAKAVRELAMMNIGEAVPEIEKFISHKNEILRMEARIALMSLYKENHLSFLDHEKLELTHWDKANIYSMLITIDAHYLPDFTQWFSVKNKSVVEFCVMMTGAFKQKKALPQLMDLLLKSDDKIKKEIVKVIRSLEAFEAEEKLIAAYGPSSIDVKLEIIKTLEVIATIKSEIFLQSILQTTQSNYALSISAIRALDKTSANGKQFIKSLQLQNNFQLNAMVTHALDQRI